MSSVNFYKPNSKTTGAAASFKTTVSDDKKTCTCYINIVKQVSWDAKTRKGSFKSEDPNNKIAIKVNSVELGGLASVIDGKAPQFSTVHVFGEDKTSILFKPYNKGDGSFGGYGLSVSKNGNKFSIGFDLNEGYVLKQFCDKTINSFFETDSQ